MAQPSKSNARRPFTEDDDALLTKYLAKYNPPPAGRNGNAIYMRLTENAESKWPWSAGHTWQSWRTRYVKDQAWFDHRIRKYQAKHKITSSDNSSLATTRKLAARKEAKSSTKPSRDDNSPSGLQEKTLKRKESPVNDVKPVLKRRKILDSSEGTSFDTGSLSLADKQETEIKNHQKEKEVEEEGEEEEEEEGGGTEQNVVTTKITTVKEEEEKEEKEQEKNSQSALSVKLKNGMVLPESLPSLTVDSALQQSPIQHQTSRQNKGTADDEHYESDRSTTEQTPRKVANGFTNVDVTELIDGSHEQTQTPHAGDRNLTPNTSQPRKRQTNTDSPSQWQMRNAPIEVIDLTAENLLESSSLRNAEMRVTNHSTISSQNEGETMDINQTPARIYPDLSALTEQTIIKSEPNSFSIGASPRHYGTTALANVLAELNKAEGSSKIDHDVVKLPPGSLPEEIIPADEPSNAFPEFTADLDNAKQKRRKRFEKMDTALRVPSLELSTPLATPKRFDLEERKVIGTLQTPKVRTNDQTSPIASFKQSSASSHISRFSSRNSTPLAIPKGRSSFVETPRPLPLKKHISLRSEDYKDPHQKVGSVSKSSRPSKAAVEETVAQLPNPLVEKNSASSLILKHADNHVAVVPQNANRRSDIPSLSAKSVYQQGISGSSSLHNKASSTYESSDTDSAESFHEYIPPSRVPTELLTNPFVDEEPRSDEEDAKLRVLATLKKAPLRLVSNTFRTSFEDAKGRLRQARIPDIDSSDDDDDESERMAVREKIPVWPPIRHSKKKSDIQTTIAPKVVQSKSGFISNYPLEPHARRIKRENDIDENSVPVAGPSGNHRTEPRSRHPFSEGIDIAVGEASAPHMSAPGIKALKLGGFSSHQTEPRSRLQDIGPSVATMQDWRSRLEHSNNLRSSSPIVHAGNKSDAFLYPEYPQRLAKGKEKARDGPVDRRQTFGGFSELPSIPRIDLRSRGKQFFGRSEEQQPVYQQMMERAIYRPTTPIDSFRSRHSRRESLASTIDLSADYYPVSLLSESDQKITTVLGLQFILKGMAENHGFSEEIVLSVYNEFRDIPTTDEVLRKMREAAEETGIKLLRKKGIAVDPDWLSSENNSRREGRQEFPPHRNFLNLRPVDDLELLMKEREKYSPPLASRAGQFVRLATQGRTEEAKRREVRRSRGMPSPEKPTDGQVSDRGEPIITLDPIVQKNVKAPLMPTWTTADDLILKIGDDYALEDLEKRMGKGSVKRRMAELIAINELQ